MSSLFGFFKASPAPLLHLITAPPFRRPAQAALEACLNSPISFHLPLTRCSVRLHLLATSHFHCLHAVNVADALLRLEPQLVEVEPGAYAVWDPELKEIPRLSRTSTAAPNRCPSRAPSACGTTTSTTSNRRTSS